jgi:hypothetical protein
MVKLAIDTKEYKEIGKIISKGLKRRDTDKSLYEPSEEDRLVPKYVMIMIKELSEYMPVPCIDKVKRHEQYAMGHVDYFSKFTLYCARLYFELKEK